MAIYNVVIIEMILSLGICLFSVNFRLNVNILINYKYKYSIILIIHLKLLEETAPEHIYSEGISYYKRHNIHKNNKIRCHKKVKTLFVYGTTINHMNKACVLYKLVNGKYFSTWKLYDTNDYKLKDYFKDKVEGN